MTGHDDIMQEKGWRKKVNVRRDKMKQKKGREKM